MLLSIPLPEPNQLLRKLATCLEIATPFVCIPGLFESIYFDRISPYGLLMHSVLFSLYGCTALVDRGRFFSFLILYTVGSTPWMGGSAHRKAATYT
jgi:hypothetical protein